MEGSLWNGGSNLKEIVNLHKANAVIQIKDLTEEMDLFVDFGKDEASIQDSIKKASAVLLDPKCPDTNRVYRILAATSDKKFSSYYEDNSCRDTGSQVYSQNVDLISVSLEWSSEAKKQVIRVTKEPLKINCSYSYATTRGGRQCD